MSTKSAATIDYALVNMIGYSPLTASCVFEYEDYDPPGITIEFVSDTDEAREESEDG